ncbi:MAG: helix-turn-helix domain-containing protein [Nocardioides sp.]
MGTDPIERAHLLDEVGFSPPVRRFAAPPHLDGVIRRFWVPVWSLPPGAVSRQRVLQYPVCQLVIAPDYARVVGPRRGMSVKELSGAGWAMGAMLQPAAGGRLLARPMTDVVDADVELADLGRFDGDALAGQVRALLGRDPADRDAQHRAAAAMATELAGLLPLTDEDRLVNAIVDYVEHDPEVRRVGQICEKFGLGERTLQRLGARRIGLSPLWLIRRRRLLEAIERLAEPDRPRLARLAGELGYADQAHFHRDFRAVIGRTPAEYAAEPRPDRKNAVAVAGIGTYPGSK